MGEIKEQPGKNDMRHAKVPGPDDAALPQEKEADTGSSEADLKKLAERLDLKAGSRDGLRRGRLIKAVVTEDDIYVSDLFAPELIEGGVLTLEDLGKFVELAKNPEELIRRGSKIIRSISREGGRRWRYIVARATTYQKVNELFGTKLPVPEHELSMEAIRAHVEKMQKPGQR